jgi:hypothetical protein
VTVPANLTSEAIDELLEQSRVEVEKRAARYGPDAMDVLHEVATSAQPGRVSKDDLEWLGRLLSDFHLDLDGGEHVVFLQEIRERFCKAPAAARVAAAKDLVAQVRPAPKPEAPQGPAGTVINVTINKLSTGERFALPIPVSSAVMDAIEAGARVADDAS